MFTWVDKENIRFLKSDILPDSLIHAFSTRICGDLKLVEHKRQNFCDVLGVDYSKLIIPAQEHTDNIAIVKKPGNIDLSETDGIITNLKNTPVMLLFADCTPVILYSDEHKVLGVIHAGWRGTAQKIVSKAVNIFKNEFSVDALEIKAVIGPAIGQCCYPVSVEVAEQLNRTIKESHDNIFLEEKGKVRVDLKKLNAQQLWEAGVREIDTTEHCTCCKNEIFYSYRADNGKTGRHCAIAAMTHSG
jgi:polyphenol oxidase